MDVRAVLSVADEIEAAERDAVSEFVRCDGLDAVGAAYAAGGIDALDGGVQRAHILNGTYPHSIILELFTDSGIGTMITGSVDDLFKHDVAARISRQAVS